MNLENDEVVNLREFLDERVALVREDYFVRNKNLDESIKVDLDLPDAAFQKLKEMCNPKLLNCEDFQRELSSVDELESEHLSIIDYTKSVYNRPSKRNQPLELKFMKNLAKLNELEPEEGDVIKTPDIVLTVQLSQPLNSKLRKLTWSEDFLVLGENLLTDLKDKITCFRDEIKIGEFSDNPDEAKSAPIMKDFIKSGYFLIENCIYNDLRGDNNDCSIPILKWAEEKNIGKFESKRMEITKFIDLGSILLGFPYLYGHLGDCEHLLIFTSLKLINPSTDCYLMSKYPIIKDKARGRFTFCWCCNKIYAKWIVCNTKFAVDDPTFLCERCLKNTHYLSLVDKEEEASDEVEGKEEDESDEFNEFQSGYKKVFDFKAYHYSQI